MVIFSFVRGKFRAMAQLISVMGNGERVCELIWVLNGLIKIDSRIGSCLEGFALQRVLLLQRSIF